MMKSKSIITIACALMALVFLGGCQKIREMVGGKLQKKEVSVEKLQKVFIDNVTAEQLDSGRILTIDTIFLNNTSGDNYSGELRGRLNDSIDVIYDLTVTDEGGDEVEAEWNRRQ